jgi:hypothetical protein
MSTSYARCDICGAVQYPLWMIHRPDCPNAETDVEQWPTYGKEPA